MKEMENIARLHESNGQNSVCRRIKTIIYLILIVWCNGEEDSGKEGNHREDWPNIDEQAKAKLPADTFLLTDHPKYPILPLMNLRKILKT